MACDYDADVWARFAVNNDASHQHVDIIEADGILTEDTRAGDSFPGAANVTSLTSTLYPLFGEQNSITDISESPDGTVSFKFRGGSPTPDPVAALEATNITPRSFTARWNVSDKATDYRLRVFSLDAAGVESPVPGFDNRLTGCVTELKVEGLEPNIKYYYTVRVVNGATESATSSAMEVTTLPLTYEYVIPVANDATEITADSFTASWLPVEDADSYLISVKRVDLDEAQTIYEAFDDKIATWPTNSDKFYANTSYTGNKAPSLKLSDGGYVCTPLLPRGTARSFSFWHRANSADNAVIHVEAYAYGCWTTLRDITPVSAKGGALTTVYNFPDAADAVRIFVTDATGSASIFVDDFAMVTSTGMTLTPVPGYTDTTVGSALTLPVKGLDADSHYIYTVKAVKGNRVSMESNPVHLHTTVSTAIEAINVDAVQPRVSVSGRTVALQALPDSGVTAYNLNGLCVKASRTDTNGYAAIILPCSGIYVIKIGQDTFKVVVR